MTFKEKRGGDINSSQLLIDTVAMVVLTLSNSLLYQLGRERLTFRSLDTSRSQAPSQAYSVLSAGIRLALCNTPVLLVV